MWRHGEGEQRALRRSNRTTSTKAAAAEALVGFWRGGENFSRQQIVNLHCGASHGNRDHGFGGEVILNDERIIVVTKQRDLCWRVFHANRFSAARITESTA